MSQFDVNCIRLAAFGLLLTELTRSLHGLSRVWVLCWCFALPFQYQRITVIAAVYQLDMEMTVLDGNSCCLLGPCPC